MFRRLILLLSFAAAAHAAYVGRPLADALRELEAKGLRLVYSDDVVTPDMIVRREPGNGAPRQVLDELLREHHLAAKRGPRGTLLIVRAPAEPARDTTAMPVTLAEIVVTPSQYELLGSDPQQKQFLSREEVQRVPHFSDDFYRAIARIPGAATDSLTARFNIRGGEEDEVVVLLDGAEIYDPFHVKDLIRAFSTIDAEAVGSVDILTGGFPAQYGGRMSGVIDIATLTPTETRTSAGVSLLNVRAMSQGVFGAGKGEWLFSFRRGYLRELLELVDNENDVDPRYYDLLGKVQWMLGSEHVLSLNVMASRDRLRMEESAGADTHATYHDNYAWLNLRSTPVPRLFAQNVLTYGTSGRVRRGMYDGRDEAGAVDDRRDVDFLAWKSDATYELTPRNLLKGGVTAKRFNARYDYDATGTIRLTVLDLDAAPKQIERAAHFDVESTELSFYAADRVRITQRLVVEAGARWESETHTPDGAHVSPRINAAWMFSDATSLRVAWGRFYQAQAVSELQVEDGVTEFHPAQRAEHRVIGIDHRFGHGVSLRAEVYNKDITSPRPRFENIYDRIVLFPELRPDRIRIAPERATARGAELLLRKDSGNAFSGWISVARASVEDEIEGRDVPRGWDQRTAVTFSANYRLGMYWNFNLAGTWHSGWPTTPLIARFENGRLESEIGPLYSERLPPYRRFDVRASRAVPTRRGTFRLFAEIFNVLNKNNPNSVGGFFLNGQPDGTIVTTPIRDATVGILPSFGLAWEF